VRAEPFGPIVRVLLCAATILVILLWLALSGLVWMDHAGIWPTLQFLSALAGEACLLMAFISADDGHRTRAGRLLLGATAAFLLWLLVMDSASLWHGIHPVETTQVN
jgi:hypothetical protein